MLDGIRPAGELRLLFGLADGDGKTVTEDEWQQFLADTITPRFRAGLTVLEGRGQWMEPSGSLQRKCSDMLMALDSEGSNCRAE